MISILQAGESWIPRTGFVFPSLEALHVVFVQLKVEYVRIFLDPGMRHALRQDDKSLLQTPPEQDLGRRLVVLGHKRFEERVVAPCTAHKRRVGLEDNTTLGTPVDDIRASEPWVELHLIDAENTSIVGRLSLGRVSMLVKDVMSAQVSNQPSATAPAL